MASPAAPKFVPFIAAETVMREFSLRAVLTGTILGMVFGASSLYLTLKVGLTVSASIPVAVISLAFYRSLSRLGVRDSTILEHNIAQTAGSAGESLAFGVGVTMPAIMILGFDLELTRVMLVAVLGGLLGILMMIPLRRALIVKEHGVLKYPEGTACAAVLQAGATEEDIRQSTLATPVAAAANGKAAIKSAGGKVIFAGFLIGLAYKVGNVALKGWREVSEKVFGAPFREGSVGTEVSPELLGVGYIIGPRIASIMCAGGVLAYLVLIPMIKFFGADAAVIVPPAPLPIAEMGAGDIRSYYILYIGAGAVAAGGIISLVRSLPTILHGMRAGLHDIGLMRPADFKVGGSGRTDRDLSMKFVGIGIVVLIVGIIAVPALHMNLLGALLIVAFGFLFVTVSSRLTGEIGSSSNPVSGMTIATLLLTCLIFLIVGWTGGTYYVTALSVGAIVCIAASNGGTTSQDLKTGYLLGGTPRLQQIAIMIGALASAMILGPILLVLNDNATVYVPAAQVAPAGLHTEVSELSRREAIKGPQASADGREFLVWHKTDPNGGPAGKYLVDETGTAVWLVDPGINGQFTQRPDGTEVRKFDAPKATLVSYIIKGILDRELPWALVLLGVMIAVTLEMAGIPSLAFAVGVYLPLSASAPIFVGGMIRGAVDWQQRRRLRHANLTEAELVAEADRSPGVLLASGYIAGGAIAGIIIAFLAGVLGDFDAVVTAWARAHNPFYSGPYANALTLLPFAVIAGVLYWVAKGKNGARRVGG
ncbi:MAG: oligopeptide transporter, OPT family [Opitutaceae bacterium]|nr:oligopeptide transporter, OPT family [Opitutaceae bacterium]